MLWVCCWVGFGIGRLDFRTLTTFTSALAESAIEVMWLAVVKID